MTLQGSHLRGLFGSGAAGRGDLTADREEPLHARPRAEDAEREGPDAASAPTVMDVPNAVPAKSPIPP